MSSEVMGERAGTLFLLLLLMTLAACQTREPAVDHMAIAQELQTRIASGGKDGQYDDPLYTQLMQELQLVPEDDPQFERARAQLKELRQAQQRALSAPDERDGGSYSREYSAADSGDARSPGKGSYVGGVWLPYQNVDVNAIARGKSGAGGGAGHPSSANSGSQVGTGPVSVTIYTASWCGVCKQAKAYMSQKGISYTEKDVEKDPGAQAEARSRSGGATGVPVIDVNGQILVGFDKAAFDLMVAKSRS